MIPKTRNENDISKSRVYYFGDTFRTIADALKPLHTTPDGEHAVRKFGTKRLAWFPKIAVLKDIALVPPTDKIEWINTISYDGSEVQELFVGNDPQKKDEDIFYDLSVERAIFAKLKKDQEYTFLGVFLKQPERAYNGAEVYQRISLYLSMDEWNHKNY